MSTLYMCVFTPNIYTLCYPTLPYSAVVMSLTPSPIFGDTYSMLRSLSASVIPLEESITILPHASLKSHNYYPFRILLLLLAQTNT